MKLRWLLTFGFIFISTSLLGQTYADYSNSWYYKYFLLNDVGSGGSSVTLSIQDNVLTLSFNATFSATPLKTGYVVDTEAPYALPDVVLGYINNSTYQVSILNNHIHVYSHSNEAIESFYNTILTVDLTDIDDTREPILYATPAHDENYIYKIQPFYPLQDLDLNSGIKGIHQVTYYDGLGRQKQQIAVGHTASARDQVTLQEYDDFGKSDKSYLTYGETNQKNGSYVTHETAVNNTVQYYQTHYNDSHPYAQSLYERSNRSQILKQAGPGADWSLGSGHEVLFAEESNTTADAVRFFEVTFLNNNKLQITLQENAKYAPGALIKRILKDENWSESKGSDHTTEVFINKSGQTILKRTFDNNVKHDTYYVYDDFGNLTYVIPPLAATQTTITNSILNELCFQYKYDQRNRLTEKKMPGKDWEYIIYDNLDRPVLLQDGNQRAKSPQEWSFNKYDAFGRVIYSGIFTTTNSVDQLTSSIEAQTGFHEERIAVATNVSGTDLHYTNYRFPNTNIEILTILYYDDYNFDLPAGFEKPFSVFNQGVKSYVKGLSTGSRTRVLDDDTWWITTVTYFDQKERVIWNGTKNEYLNSEDITLSEYDFQGRTTKSRTRHKKGTHMEIVTLNTFTYDHVGRLLYQEQCIGDDTLPDQCKSSSDYESSILLNDVITETKDEIAAKEIILKPNFHIKATSSLSFSASIDATNDPAYELISANFYDDTGMLVKKDIGNSKGAPLQSINYTYNIKGWLKAINNVEDLGEDLFGFKINYTNLDTGNSQITPLYNGNISETYWKTANDSQLRGYSYTYDALNRLKIADYKNTANTAENYKVDQIAYDKNGNLESLRRYGMTNTNTYTYIDDLSYHYGDTPGNKLFNVYDKGSLSYGFKGENLPTTSQEYWYDANGNMIKDTNKGITSIAYNHLNLPWEIKVGTSNVLWITYDSQGNKIRKHVWENGVITETDYAEGYVYINDDLQFFNHPEGYITPNGLGGYSYVYNYKDHLDSNRLSYTDANNDGNIDPANEVIEENNYYPFGLKMQGYNNSVSSLGNSVAGRWKFGGKEYDQNFDINTYDFGARNYDPALGRWMNIDPLAEDMRRHSPYNYAFNNPIYFIDPDGMMPQECCPNPIPPFNLTGLKILYRKFLGLPPINVEGDRSSSSGEGTRIWGSGTGEGSTRSDGKSSGNTVDTSELPTISGTKGSGIAKGAHATTKTATNMDKAIEATSDMKNLGNNSDKESNTSNDKNEATVNYTVEGDLKPNAKYGVNNPEYGGTGESAATKDSEKAKQDSIQFYETGLFIEGTIRVRSDTIWN